MFRKTLIAAALLATGAAHAALSTGDLAFTAYNADEDGWSMVTFVDIAANSTVYFSDNEWNGSAFNTGESYHQWNSGASTISAGSVIRFSKIDSSSQLSASAGSLSRASVAGSTNFGMSQDNDTIYAYVGSSATAPTSFLAAISTGAFSASQGELTNTGLSVGAGAVQLGNGSDFAEYTGARSGLTSFGAYKSLVSNVANWNDRGNGSYAALVPDTTGFSVIAVPEPEQYAMLLAGLGVIGAVARRRKQA